MSTKYIQDMTKGNELPLILKFMFPMLLGNIFQQFYNLVDSIVVGKFVNSNALAAVGACGSLSFLFVSVCFGLSVGIGIIISQNFGAGNQEQIKSAITNAAYVIGAAGILMSIVATIFASQVLQLMNTPAEIINDSVRYFRIISGGMIAMAAYNAIASILRALGDSRTPLIFLIVSCIINIILDLIFVLVFHLGVAGVAYATVISQACSAVSCIIFACYKNPYFRLKMEDWKVNRSIITKCIRIGIPVALQNSMIAISMVSLQRVINGFGETVVAAYTATSRVEQLIQQPFNTLGAAMATFSGQNMGANKLDRVKKGYHKGIFLVALFSILALAMAQLGGRAIMEIFVDEEEVIKLGARAIKITSCAYFPLGMIYVTRGLLNGTGDAVYSMINGIVEVIGRVGFSSSLARIPVLGAWSVWLTSGLTWTITAIASVIRYKQGKWKKKSLVKSNVKVIDYNVEDMEDYNEI